MVGMAIANAVVDDAVVTLEARDRDLRYETARGSGHSSHLTCLLDLVVELCGRQHLTLSPVNGRPAGLTSATSAPSGLASCGPVPSGLAQCVDQGLEGAAFPRANPLSPHDPLLPLSSGTSYARSRRRSSDSSGSRLVFSSPPVDGDDWEGQGQAVARPGAVTGSTPGALAHHGTHEWVTSPLSFDADSSASFARVHSPSGSITTSSSVPVGMVVGGGCASPTGAPPGPACAPGSVTGLGSGLPHSLSTSLSHTSHTSLTRSMSEGGIVDLTQHQYRRSGGCQADGARNGDGDSDDVIRRVLSAHNLQSLSPENTAFVTAMRMWLEVSRSVMFALLHLSPVDSMGEEDPTYMAILKCALHLAQSSTVIMESITLRIVTHFPDRANRCVFVCVWGGGECRHLACVCTCCVCLRVCACF